MRRKLRHPHQVMEASELVVNEWYRTPTLYRDGHMWDHKAFLLLGRVRSTPRAALGHKDVSVGGGATPGLLTIHEDGWFGRPILEYPPPEGDLFGTPTLYYWNMRGDTRGWDHLASYLGEPRPGHGDDAKMHCIMVPEAAWLADPRMHVVDWINPGDAVVRAAGRLSGDPSDPMAGARRRTEENLRWLFGR